jgi:hypothetical protein
MPSATVISHTIAPSETPAPQPTPSNTSRPFFDRLDRNRDGVLKLDEFLAWDWRTYPHARQFFQMADLNHDGTLTFNEFDEESSTRHAQAAATVKAVDTNRDGQLSYQELLSAPIWGRPIGGFKPGEKERVVREFLTQHDVDRNHTLSLSEVRAAIKQSILQPPVEPTPMR